MEKTNQGGTGERQERQTGRRKAPTKGKRWPLVLLCVCVLAAVIGFGVRAWVQMPEVPITPQNPSVQAPPSAGEGAVSDRKPGVYTFLVAGKDVASGSTDVMLLLTYDTTQKTVVGLNLPRDTMINTANSNKRLNAVYSYNRGSGKEDRKQAGMTALKEAVAKQTGILPDFYVMVEWEAIGNLVNALGGVEFTVPFDMDYDDPFQDPPLHIHQKAGTRVLTGDDAMQIIRWRKNNDGSGGEGGDIARLAIQQDFLKAVAKKCLQPATFLKIGSLVEVFKENVETDLTIGNIAAFAEQAIGMDPDTGVSFTTAPLKDSFRFGPNRAALITLDPEGVLEIINTAMNPYTRDIVVEDLEMVVRNADGTFTVTSGTIAEDINRAVTPPAPKPQPEPEPIPEEPGVTEPEMPAEGEEPGVEEPPEADDPEEPGTEGEIEVPGQPEPILPDPEDLPEPPEVESQPETELEPPIENDDPQLAPAQPEEQAA